MRKAVPAIADSPDKRRQLVTQLEADIYAGINARAGLEDVWRRVEHMHINARPLRNTSPQDNLVPIHRPLLQPRLDQLAAQVCSVVAGSDPYMLATSGDDTLSSKREKTLHRLWQTAGFDQQIRKAAIIAGDTNRAIWRISYALQVENMLPEGDETIQDKMSGSITYSGLAIDVIHPRDFTLSPATSEGIQSAQLVGHRFYRSAQYIKERQAIGEYFDDAPPVGGDDPLEHRIRYSQQYVNYVPLDDTSSDPVELWDVIVRMRPSQVSPINENKRQRYFLATLAIKQGLLLRFEEYPFSRPWYFESGFLVEPEDFWGDGKSVGKNLYPLQEEYNNNCTLLYNGALMSALPPLFGPQLNTEKTSYYGPREYIPVDGEVKIQSFGGEFHGEDIRANNADIERNADSVAGISANNTGAPEQHELSATQSQQIAAGVGVSITEYIRSFTANFPAMASLTEEILDSYYPLWRPFYSDLQITKQELSLPAMWEVNGKSPADTPMARMIQVQQLIGFGEKFPQACYDMYELGKLQLALSNLPGADKIQMERPSAIPQQLNPQAQDAPGDGQGVPGQPGMGDPNPVPTEPQDAGNAGPLPPLPASVVRPSADFNTTGKGGTH